MVAARLPFLSQPSTCPAVNPPSAAGLFMSGGRWTGRLGYPAAARIHEQFMLSKQNSATEELGA
jgi:hypothetical protein